VKTSDANGMVRQLQKRENRIRELEAALKWHRDWLGGMQILSGPARDYGEVIGRIEAVLSK
jgi:hypothetical protein